MFFFEGNEVYTDIVLQEVVANEPPRHPRPTPVLAQAGPDLQ